MGYFLGSIVWLIGFSIIILIRNEIVYRNIMKNLSTISSIARAKINRGEDWEIVYKNFDATTYNSMLFDLTKWSWDIDDEGRIK